MDAADREKTPVEPTAHDHHRYANVKWYHAVNTQQQLVEATQEITRLYYGDDLSRRGSLERSPSVSSTTEAGGGNNAAAAVPPPPPYRVFGLEADIQWHPSLGNAVMHHDPIPDSTKPSTSSSSPPPSGLEDLFSLEVFLYTVAQAVQGWKSRAAAATPGTPPGPLHVIVKLDFKAYKAAQQLLANAENRTWAGLEALCLSANSTRSRRRSSIRSLAAASRLESASSYNASASAFAPAPSVHVELWWNADVVAQPGAPCHPLSVAAAPVDDVVTLLTRTAQALSPRIAFGFSLGWVLSQRPVPAAVLEKYPSKSSTAPVYATYKEEEDVPPMLAFLDKLAAAVLGGAAPPPPSPQSQSQQPQQQQQQQQPLFPSVNTATNSARSSRGNNDSSAITSTPPRLTAANQPACHIRLLTFPMLFETVFADLYSEDEKAAAFQAAAGQVSPAIHDKDSTTTASPHPRDHHGHPHPMPASPQPVMRAVSSASLVASALAAAECRRAATAVVTHAAQLFFAHPSSSTSTPLQSREGSSRRSPAEAAPSSGSGNANGSGNGGAGVVVSASAELRCFPTFWKVVHAPPGATAEWQADVNRAARSIFPYCTIDG